MKLEHAEIKEILKEIKRKALSEDEIKLLCEKIEKYPPDVVAKRLFHILTNFNIEFILSNVFRIFGTLASENERWNRIISKSTMKKGRCPEAYKKNLKNSLKSERYDDLSFKESYFSSSTVSMVTSTSSPTRITMPDVAVKRSGLSNKISFIKRKRDFSIKITTELTSIGKISDLLAKLNDFSFQNDSLVLDIDNVDHLYVHGLCFLCSWCVKNKILPQIKCNKSKTEDYLEKICFYDIIWQRPVDKELSGRKSYLCITEINKNSKTDIVSSEIAEIVRAFGTISIVEKTQLIIILSELIENVQRHSNDKGYAVAQLYPQRNKVGLSIVDSGIGIETSFLQGNNGEAIKKLEIGSSPLDLACDPLITSKPEKGHAGYGLYVVSETVMRNGGTFVLTSGKETIMRYIKQKEKISNRSHHNIWNGTAINIIIDLNNHLPINDVYETLPEIPGYEMEDFFNE